MPIVRTRPVLETYNFDGRLYRHPHAFGRQWSSYYGMKGGGFGHLSWQEAREIGRDYPDLGFLYEVVLRKGISKILFHGLITGIEEAQRQGNQVVFSITALGFGSLFEWEVFNKVYSDCRPGKWQSSQEASGTFQPDKFSVRLEDGIYLKPRRGVDFVLNEYVYVRYSIPFGYAPNRMTFDYDVALPVSWPGMLEIRDDNGALWSQSATASGTGEVVTASDGATYFEVRFYVTAAGENTAEDDTVYGGLTNVTVWGDSTTTLDASTVLSDMVAYLASRYDISSSTGRIASTGQALPATVAFEDDRTPKQVMEWCAQFGGSDNALLAWGIELNDLKRAYLEKQDLTTIRYIVRRRSGLDAQVKGDFAQSRQKIYGVYADANGAVQRTADVSMTDFISNYLNGYYRRGAYQLQGTAESEDAQTVIDMALQEEYKPKVTTSFTVRDQVYTVTGKALAIDELQAGGIVLVDDFRAREATLSATDYRTQWSSFQLIGVEIDEEQNAARLIPAGDRRSFEQYLARLAAMRQGS